MSLDEFVGNNKYSEVLVNVITTRGGGRFAIRSRTSKKNMNANCCEIKKGLA
jgi:hypothetical protein